MNAFFLIRSHVARLPALALAGLMAAGISAAQSPSNGSTPDRWVDTGAPTTQTRGVGVDRNGWHRDRERGWHWYESDPNPPSVVPVQPPQGAPGSPQSEPEPLSVLWLQEKLEETRIAAIDNPTRENVELYVYLQKMAMDKAEKFAIMSQQVAMINPDLDENYQNPTSTFVRRARLDTRDNEQERVLRALAENVGIYYFYRSDCAYCARQNPILKRMEAEHGLRILPISIDHLPSHDGAFPNWQPDQGQARALGVNATPTMYLYHPPNDVAFLAAGLQSEPQLIKRIFQVAEANGWLAREDLEKAMRGMPREFLLDAVQDLEDVDWSDPNRALEALRHASRHGVERASLTTPFAASTPVNPAQESPVRGTPVQRNQ